MPNSSSTSDEEIKVELEIEGDLYCGGVELCCYSGDAEVDDEVVGGGCSSSSSSSSSSCHSEFYSTYNEEEEDSGGGMSRRRVSFSDSCSVVNVDDDLRLILNLDDNKTINNNNVEEKECRICHMSLVVVNEEEEEEDDAIELGCCCKDDLAAAHKHCALTWFQIKGNKTCEICNSIVTNLVIPNEMTTSHATIDMNPAATSVATSHMSTTRGGRGCINGHRLLNFILACLVFAFVISWLFHFNIPS